MRRTKQRTLRATGVGGGIGSGRDLEKYPWMQEPVVKGDEDRPLRGTRLSISKPAAAETAKPPEVKPEPKASVPERAATAREVTADKAGEQERWRKVLRRRLRELEIPQAELAVKAGVATEVLAAFMSGDGELSRTMFKSLNTVTFNDPEQGDVIEEEPAEKPSPRGLETVEVMKSGEGGPLPIF